MKNLSLSTKIYIGLVLALSLLSGITVFLPQGSFVPTQELPASKPVMAVAIAFIFLLVYGGVGFLGLQLSTKLGFAEIWDLKVSNKERFLIPAIIGIGVGLFFILADTIFSKFNTVGKIPHPPFPTSFFASLSAGIGEELIFRLFFISFWVWLISYVILKRRWQNYIFWIVAFFSALAFAFAHLPSIMVLFGFKSFNAIPPLFLLEIILLNGVVSFFCAYYFRKFGFLAAVGIHFWTDIVWHLIWGMI
jgi:membrane protease YdiL (CAAX protease family)